VVVGMVDPSAALWAMFVQGVAGFTRPGGRQVWKNAVSQQSGCPTPCFSIECFEHRRGPRELQYVDRSSAVKVAVSALQPGCRRGIAPDESRASQHVLEVDQHGCGGRPGSLFAFHPS
jgi:hypothetical protein